MGIKGRLSKGKNLERTIEDMAVGEIAYSVPWCLAFDEEEVPHLNLGSTIHKSKGGTVELEIKRTGTGNSDYDINIENIDYKWHKSNDLFGSVVGVDTSKIVQLSYDDEIQKDTSIPYNQQIYPKTWKLREELNKAIQSENYRTASKLKDEINKSDEPLD